MKKIILLSVAIISLTNFVNPQNPQWINYTNGDRIFALADEGNFIWIGTGGGLVQFDKTTSNTTFYNTSNSGLPGNDITSITIDVNGNKWIGTWGDGIAIFDGTNWTVYNTSNSSMPSNWVESIAIDGNGTKWIGTTDYYGMGGGGLAAFDGTNWSLYNTNNSGLPHNNVLFVSIDNNGTKWIGTWGGLAVYNENGIPYGIHEYLNKRKLVNIFPNPVNDVLNIESISNKNISYIEIINIQGLIIKRLRINKSHKAIDISELSDGIYIIRIRFDQGIAIKKIIKQR